MNVYEVRETLDWLKYEYKGAFKGGQRKLYGLLKRREEQLLGIPSRLGKPGPVRVYNMYQ